MASVVHLTTVHHPHDPRIADREVSTLRAAGYRVRLVAQAWPGTRPDVPLPRAETRLRRLRLSIPAFRRAAAERAALYHIHDPELIPVAWALKKTTGARVVYDMHEDYAARGGVEGRALRALEWWCFRWVNHVVLAADGLEPITRGAPVPTTTLPNYFRPPAGERATPRSWAGGRLELLAAGVQGRGRGLGTLLSLAGLIRARGLPWRVTLGGICYRAADRAWAEERIRAEGLGPALRLVGWDRYVPWPELAPLYRQADVGLCLFLAHPNHGRTVPTKFAEYLHYGLPIVASSFPRWQDFMRTHACGATADPEDAQAVLSVLQAWAADPRRYQDLSAAAAAAAPQFYWSRVAPRLVRLYDELLHGAG